MLFWAFFLLFCILWFLWLPVACSSKSGGDDDDDELEGRRACCPAALVVGTTKKADALKQQQLHSASNSVTCTNEECPTILFDFPFLLLFLLLFAAVLFRLLLELLARGEQVIVIANGI